LKNNGIIHKTSAPYHPATNGQAERYAQTIKKSLSKVQGEGGDIYMKTMRIKTYLRRSPNCFGKSPYNLMFGREVRTQLHIMFRGNCERIPRDHCERISHNIGHKGVWNRRTSHRQGLQESTMEMAIWRSRGTFWQNFNGQW
jgi:hypothetical protein